MIDVGKLTDAELRARISEALAAPRARRTGVDGEPLLAMELMDATLQELYAEMARRDAIVKAQAASADSKASNAPDDLALLDARDVAARLGIPVASVYELVRRKKIGCVRVSVGSRKGKQRRFKVSPAQLRAFIASNSDAAA